MSHKCFFTLYLRWYSHSLYVGRNVFQSNFSPSIFWSSVYLSQPYTSVLHTNLIQLGNARQWLTPPWAQHSTRGPGQYRSVFLLPLRASDHLKGLYPPPVHQRPFSKRGSAGEVMGDGDNDASGSSVGDAAALYRAACNESLSPLKCTPQSWGTDGLGIYLRFLNVGEIKTFFTALIRFV